MSGGCVAGECRLGWGQACDLADPDAPLCAAPSACIGQRDGEPVCCRPASTVNCGVPRAYTAEECSSGHCNEENECA